MNSYKTWKEKKNEATDRPVDMDPANQQDDTEPEEHDNLFYKGQYSGVVGPLLSRLGGIVSTDARFRRPAIKGLLLQDIILALGLNQDIGLFTRIANRIRNQLNAAENPSSLHFASPTLARALAKKGITQTSEKQPATQTPLSTAAKPVV